MSAPPLTRAAAAARLAHVRPVERDIFLAIRVDGMSYAEVAGRLGWPRRRVERAMARVVAALDEEALTPRPWWPPWQR